MEMVKRIIETLMLCMALIALMIYSASCMERFQRRADRHLHEAADPKQEDEHDHEGESHEEHADHDEHAEGEAHDHAEHEEDAGHAHAHAEIVKLGSEVLKEYGVVVASAKPGKLENFLTLPGEVAIDTDRVAHVVTPITGVVAAVHKNLGDPVRRGDLMIELDSMELAEAKSRYLETIQHLKLAQATYEREEKLWKQGISAEQEYLAARNKLAEAEIALQTVKQTLQALRVPKAEIDKLSAGERSTLTRYRVYASSSGRVVEKHISKGELLTPEQEAFTLADLSTVWIKLSVHQRDLEKVRVGQHVAISTPDGKGSVKGKVDYIEPVIGEETRQAVARVRLSNPGGDLRPGLFVTGKIVVEQLGAAVLIPQDAVQTVDGKSVVFVEDEHGFETREVTLGRQSETHVEITRGLELGEKYVAENAFLVKAELAKASAAHEH
jgi:cobalt-zinc-cadmium efflux system membrane fusion protein